MSSAVSPPFFLTIFHSSLVRFFCSPLQGKQKGRRDQVGAPFFLASSAGKSLVVLSGNAASSDLAHPNSGRRGVAGDSGNIRRVGTPGQRKPVSARSNSPDRHKPDTAGQRHKCAAVPTPSLLPEIPKIPPSPPQPTPLFQSISFRVPESCS